ncbi:hypothetical protein [Corticibacter populi]|nr:hypothetical protein [Corticibacter populi]
MSDPAAVRRIRATALTLLCSMLLAACGTTSQTSAAPSPFITATPGVLGGNYPPKTAEEQRAARERQTAPADDPKAQEAQRIQSAQAMEALKQAEQAYADGEWEKAASAFKGLIQTHPRNAQVWFGYATATAFGGDLAEAAMAFEQVLAINPQDVRSAYNLTLIRLSQAELALQMARAQESAAPERLKRELQELSAQLTPLFRDAAQATGAAASDAASAIVTTVPAPNPNAGAAFRVQDPARAADQGRNSTALSGLEVPTTQP